MARRKVSDVEVLRLFNQGLSASSIGKTTLGVLCGMRVAEKLGQDFNIKEQVRQGGGDFLKGMDWCVENKRSVIVYDEAGDFNTRASLTYFNQNMNRVFET